MTKNNSQNDHFEYIKTHYTSKIAERIGYCLRTTKRKSPSGLIIQGPTGLGKTTTCEKEQQRINSKYIANGLLPPVFIVGSPSTPSTKSYYIAILEALGGHQPLHGSTDAIRIRLYAQLLAMQVKVLIFDEFQQLIEKRKTKVVKQILDDIKSISDKFQIACIFVGTDRVVELSEINTQFASRFCQVIKINYMGFNTEKKQEITRKFISSYIAKHNIKGMNFDGYEDCLRMFAATKGDLRIFVNLLDDASGFLTGETQKALSLNSLKQAYSLMPKELRVPNLGNPFAAEIRTIQNILEVKDYLQGEKI